MDHRRVSFLILSCFTLVKAAHIPEVYEDPQKSDADKAPAFDYRKYQKSVQQDPQQMRYIQQQQVDKFNIPKVIDDQIQELTQTAPMRVPVQSNWKMVHPKFVTENRSYTPTKERQSSKERSEDEAKEKLERQDSQSFLYVSPNTIDSSAKSPKVLQQVLGGFVGNQPEVQLQALNSLIGQKPSVQLHGLQQLLMSNQRVKDHNPIQEAVDDAPKSKVAEQLPVANALQMITHVPSNPEALKNLQAQLDATASVHAQKILAQAQQKAVEHVKAQHAAIARAQAEAEKIALIELKAQNEALAKAQADNEARRQAEIVARRESEAKALERTRKQAQQEQEKRKLEERKKVEARERARLAALQRKLKKEQEQAKAELVKKQQSSETQQHFVTQQAPFQVIADSHESSHEDSYVREDHELQYASKYAFGYRIRDYHNGNDFGHEESKEGVTTKGHYHVLLPDGRLQTVKYYVDPSGYHAEVTYNGSSEQQQKHQQQHN